MGVRIAIVKQGLLAMCYNSPYVDNISTINIDIAIIC